MKKKENESQKETICNKHKGL